MRVAVIGAGGVGGYFGGRLAASGADVHFLARGRHLQALQNDGLRIDSPKGNVHVKPVNATDDPKTIGPVDVVLFTVKLYDLDSALQLLPPLIGPDTVVVPFQNGVESVDAVTRTVGKPHVAGGTAYVMAVISEPGVIRHTAMDQLIFGELDGRRSARLEGLLAASEKAGFQGILSDHIDVDIWTKFSRLTTFSGMTAVTRSPMGPLRDDPELFEMMMTATREAAGVAAKKGIQLPASFMEDTIKIIRNSPPNTKSSMLEDLERGRPLELPWLSGAVARFGHELGVPTPTHQFIAAVLKPFVRGVRT